MKAQEYFKLFHTRCVFRNLEDVVCGKPAVAVYVSDDEEPKGRYVCQAHAEESEAMGDGPVFYQKPEEVQGG